MRLGGFGETALPSFSGEVSDIGPAPFRASQALTMARESRFCQSRRVLGPPWGAPRSHEGDFTDVDVRRLAGRARARRRIRG